MANFVGVNYANLRVPRFYEIRYATAGFAYSHATESGIIGLRNGWGLKVKAVTREARGNKITTSYDVEFGGDAIQTTFAEIKNVMLLSKALHQLRLKTGDSEYLRFEQNTGTYTAPNASELVALGWEFVLDDKTRELKLKWQTRLTDTELDWIFANIAVAGTGSSGGTSGGLTAQARTKANALRPGFGSILVGGNIVGAFSSGKISLKSGGTKDNLERELNSSITIKTEGQLLQASASEVRAAITQANADVTVLYNTLADEIFSFTSGAASFTMSELSRGEKDGENYLKFECDGLCPFNANEATPTSIDLGVTTPGTASFLLT